MSNMLFNQLCSKYYSHVMNIKACSDFDVSLLFKVAVYCTHTAVSVHLDPIFRCSAASRFTAKHGSERKACYLGSRFNSFLNLLLIITQKNH